MARDTVLLEDLAWPEVEEAIETGTDTVVIGVGAIEQHGPHLPLVIDTLTGEEIPRRVAERLGDALAAPPVRPGCSGHHMDFPGTITIPPEVLMDTLRGYCRSLDSHGFEHLVLLPTHGGNFAPVNTVAPEIARELDASVITLADLDEFLELLNQGLRDAGIEYQEPIVHAGAAETAMVLAIAEGIVRKEELELGHEQPVSGSQLFARGFRAVTGNGVLGDPRKATAEAGDAILERITDRYVEHIESELEMLESE